MGRLSIRDEKEPQIVINRVRPISDFADRQPNDLPEEAAPDLIPGKLYLRLPSEGSPLYAKVRAIVSMFPGDSAAVLYFADTGSRRGSRCGIRESMLRELKRLLGEENVVVK